MAKLSRKTGSTSQMELIFIPDTSSAVGGGLAGLTNASSGLTCYYKRNTASAAVQVATINTISTLGTYAGTSTQAAFKSIDNTNMVGTYEFHVPNNALASGADSAIIMLYGAANMLPIVFEIELTATDNQDSAAGGMTGVPISMTQSLPASPTANTTGESLYLADLLGGRFGTAQAGGPTSITLDSGASSDSTSYVGDSIFLYGGTGGGFRGVGQQRGIVAYNGSTKVATVDRAWSTNPDNTTTFMTIRGGIANAWLWRGTVLAAPATAGIPDANIKNINNVAAATPGAAGGLFIAGTNAATTVTTSFTTTFTGNLSGNVTGSVGSVASGGITSASFATGAIDAGAIATDAIGANELSQAAADKVWSTAARTLTTNPGLDAAGIRSAVGLASANLDTQIATLSTYAGGAVASVTAAVTVGTNNDKTGYKLASDGLDSVAVESGVNARQTLAIIAAASAGKASGLDTAAPVFKGLNNTTTRISAITDADGNRSAVTLTLP